MTDTETYEEVMALASLHKQLWYYVWKQTLKKYENLMQYF